MKEYNTIELNLQILEDALQGYNEEKDFTTLDAWRKSRALKLFFYKKVIPKLPIEEKFNLNIQSRKAAVSSTSNIAEGYGRFHYQEGIQFYRIARGSIFELKDDLITCFDLDFIDEALFKEGILLIEDAKKTLNGFIRFVQNQKSKKST